MHLVRPARAQEVQYPCVNQERSRLPSQNLVVNGDFELGINNWWSWTGSTIGISSAESVSDSHSLYITDRADNGNAVYDLTSVAEAGTTYWVSAWAKHQAVAPDTIRLVAKVGCASGDDYIWLESDDGVEPDTWTELSGSFTIDTACDITQILVYFEGTSGGADVYVDDVSVTPL